MAELEVIKMKEMYLRNRISKDKKKREYCIEEVTFEGGFLKKTQKNCLYVVKKDNRFASWRDLLVWINVQKAKDPASLREVYITRSIHPETSEGRVLMKITGTVFAMLKGEIYSIKYTHSIAFGLVRRETDWAKRE